MTPQQQEILDILQEECAEAIQMVSKIRRFGIDTDMYKQDSTNREAFTSEVGDILAMIELAIEYGVVNQADVDDAKSKKVEKLKKWSNIFKYDKDKLKPCHCRRCAEKRAEEKDCVGASNSNDIISMSSELCKMFLCPECGNKRCPHATDHNYACTGSNEPGQEGSDY